MPPRSSGSSSEEESTQAKPSTMARLAHRRRPGVRPRRLGEQLARLAAAHARPDAAVGRDALARLMMPRASMSAPSPMRALAVATAAIAMPSFLRVGEAAHASFVLADAGIVVDGGAAAEFGRHVGGIDRAVAAADHDGAVGFRRQLHDAVVGEDRDVHRGERDEPRCVATYARKTAFMRVRWPLPCDLNHFRTSRSSRNVTGDLPAFGGRTNRALRKNSSSSSGTSEKSMSLSLTDASGCSPIGFLYRFFIPLPFLA